MYVCVWGGGGDNERISWSVTRVCVCVWGGGGVDNERIRWSVTRVCVWGGEG